MKLSYTHVKGGGVPGGHKVFYGQKGHPFIPYMPETDAIPLHHTDVVADIGAFVGTYSIRAARFPVRLVNAFEPTKIASGLIASVALPNLRVHRAAVTAKDIGTTKFFVSKKGIGTTNSLLPSKVKGAITVPAIDYTTAVRGATIIKIDIEGGEYLLPIVPVADSVRAIIIDFHPVVPYWQARSDDIISELERSGFKPVVKPGSGYGWTYNGAWLRETQEPTEVCDALMSGKACCGCGAKFLVPLGAKGLCAKCWGEWSQKHRLGFRTAHS